MDSTYELYRWKLLPTSTSVVVSETVPTTSVASAEKLPQVPVGSTLTLNAANLGPAKGQTLLLVDKLTLGVQIDEWTGDHATVTLPMLGINGPTKAEIVLVKADGYAASKVKVELIPAPSSQAQVLRDRRLACNYGSATAG